jgi:hypothetical protein
MNLLSKILLWSKRSQSGVQRSVESTKPILKSQGPRANGFCGDVVHEEGIPQIRKLITQGASKSQKLPFGPNHTVGGPRSHGTSHSSNEFKRGWGMSLEKNRATHANKTILPLKLNDVVPVAKMSNENVFWQQVGRINGIHGFTGGRGEGIRKIKKMVQ